jgi:serine/threonine protein kinase
MLSGKSPFKAATDYLIFQKIKNLEYTIPQDFPPVGKDIVERLLVSDPEKRLGSGDIQAIKEHAFFEGIDWENIFSSNAPPLRERLEKEAKAHPVIPPTFGFEQSEGEEEEDMWFGQNAPLAAAAPTQVPYQNPFNDHIHSVQEQVPPQVAFDTPTCSSTASAQDAADRHKSHTSRHSSGLKDDNMKRASQLSSVASSAHSIPERSNGQPHPLW